MEAVIQKCMEKVFKELGGGYKESVYQNALTHELRVIGYSISKEVNVPVLYEGVDVGTVRLDLLIDGKYIIEFKALQKIGDKERNQIKRYLKLCNSTEGYLINCNLEKYEVIKISI